MAEAVVGASALKSAKSSTRLAKAIDSIPGSDGLRTVARYYGEGKRVATAPARIAGTYVVRGAVEGGRLSVSAGKRVVGVAPTTGAKVRVGRVLREVDGGKLDGLSATQQQRIGRILVEIDPDFPLASLTRNLDRVDDVVRRDGVTIVRGERHGVAVEARYLDNGHRYVAELDAGEGLSKGGLGERAAYEVAAERGLRVPDGFRKNAANQEGIDLVAIDPDTGEHVLIEAKFSSRSGNIGKGDLSTSTGNRQMSDDWIDDAIPRMEDSNLITSDLRTDLEQAIARGDVRKEIVDVKNTRKSGNTVTSSLTEEGLDIDRVTIVKTGEAVK